MQTITRNKSAKLKLAAANLKAAAALAGADPQTKALAACLILLSHGRCKSYPNELRDACGWASGMVASRFKIPIEQEPALFAAAWERPVAGDGSDLLRDLDQVESLVGNVPYGPLDKYLHAVERGHAIHIVGAI